MNTNTEDIKHIRFMMERSSKFLSLSGISGISAGITALLGGCIAHYILQGTVSITGNILYDLIVLAILTIMCAGGLGFLFSMQKAKKNNAKFWMPVTIQILKDFSIPMFVGGLFSFILILQQATYLVAATMLIFYGLALITAGTRTYSDVKKLGACEILLGVLAGIFPYNGLLFWCIGFGIMHIIYGIIIYLKYDSGQAYQNQ